MRGGLNSSNILGIAAACLLLSSLPVSGTQPAAYLDELKALAELHEQGMLTDEEFAAKKAQLLDLDPKETKVDTTACPVSCSANPQGKWEVIFGCEEAGQQVLTTEFEGFTQTFKDGKPSSEQGEVGWKYETSGNVYRATVDVRTCAESESGYCITADLIGDNLGDEPVRCQNFSPSSVEPEKSVGAAQVSDAGKARTVKLREGTEIYLVFAEALSSGSNVEGDRFNLRLDDDVKVDGTVVIPRDAIAVGTVTVAKKRRRMGRAGQLSIRLEYVKAGDERVRLRSNKSKEGEGKVGSTVALTVLFGPLGLLKRGKDIEVQNGSPITAFVDQDVELTLPD